MWTTHQVLPDSDLWRKGKLHAQKFVAHRYSREDNRVMLFKLWSADTEFTSCGFGLAIELNLENKSYDRNNQWTVGPGAMASRMCAQTLSCALTFMADESG